MNIVQDATVLSLFEVHLNNLTNEFFLNLLFDIEVIDPMGPNARRKVKKMFRCLTMFKYQITVSLWFYLCVFNFVDYLIDVHVT